MRHQGTITFWKDEQGYGFITPDDGGTPVFVHVKALPNRHHRPEMGDVFHYEITTDERGRKRAERVTVPGVRPSAKSTKGNWGLGATYTILFLIVLLGAMLLGRLPYFIPAIYFVLSLVTLAVYANDKQAALDGRWRTAENTLHMLALAGGWPGALIAQQVLRHKSSKTAFLITFWVTVLLNSAAAGWLLSPQGDAFLHTHFIDEMWLHW